MNICSLIEAEGRVRLVIPDKHIHSHSHILPLEEIMAEKQRGVSGLFEFPSSLKVRRTENQCHYH